MLFYTNQSTWPPSGNRKWSKKSGDWNLRIDYIVSILLLLLTLWLLPVADPEGASAPLPPPIDVQKNYPLWPLSLSEGLRVLIYCGWVITNQASVLHLLEIHNAYRKLTRLCEFPSWIICVIALGFLPTVAMLLRIFGTIPVSNATTDEGAFLLSNRNPDFKIGFSIYCSIFQNLKYNSNLWNR